GARLMMGAVRRPRCVEPLPTGSDGFACASLARRHRHGGNGEPERSAAAIARSHPDPAAEAALDDEPAEIQTESQAALGSVAPGRPGLLEQPLEAAGGPAGPAGRERHPQPAAPP